MVTLKELNDILFENDLMYVTAIKFDPETGEYVGKEGFAYCPDLTDDDIQEMATDSIEFGYSPDEIAQGYKHERELSVKYANARVHSYDRKRHECEIVTTK